MARREVASTTINTSTAISISSVDPSPPSGEIPNSCSMKSMASPYLSSVYVALNILPQCSVPRLLGEDTRFTPFASFLKTSIAHRRELDRAD